MCEFKSGIILKNRVYIGTGDSHSEMLNELKIADTYLNATKTFVRAELIPPNNEWWTDPDGWKLNIDQDITPDWFNIDREKYTDEFKASVKAWWQEHVQIDKKIDEHTSG